MDYDRETECLERHLLNLNVLVNHPGVLRESESVWWILKV